MKICSGFWFWFWSWVYNLQSCLGERERERDVHSFHGKVFQGLLETAWSWYSPCQYPVSFSLLSFFLSSLLSFQFFFSIPVVEKSVLLIKFVFLFLSVRLRHPLFISSGKNGFCFIFCNWIMIMSEVFFGLGNDSLEFSLWFLLSFSVNRQFFFINMVHLILLQIHGSSNFHFFYYPHLWKI